MSFAPSGFTTLPDAINIIGAEICGSDWTGTEGHAAKNWRGHLKEDEDARERHRRAVAALHHGLERGDYTSAFIAADGRVQLLEQRHWRTDDAEWALEHGRWPDYSVRRTRSMARRFARPLLLRLPVPSRSTPSTGSRTVSVERLTAFLVEHADGCLTESECRQAAEASFAMQIPEKSVWRPAWKAVPADKKRQRGAPRLHTDRDPAQNTAK